ncbi:uncharacterized protein LOC124693340 [Lolium rigidum]|uniref:uncharacterized protein LOC124693340 n=1 Tax=Lolium rigidum TaxID=89674 RepID=UPI001F5D816A|nr:uncharacterized protein LOC124693340 [Lolium rigidum]XP_047082770.1 uncharacterized protein LOC124693340 [Lolium rigidum]
MANFGGSGGDLERIIHGRQIVFAARSKYDAKMWTCGCGWENFPTRYLLFDLPAWRCRICLAPFTGNVDFSMADIKVNGIPLIQMIKDQRTEPECIAFAIAHLIEIIHRLECILKKEYLGIWNSTLDTRPLVEIYKYECPMMSEEFPPYYNVGLHKLLYLCQHIRNQGISFKTGKHYRIEKMSTIYIGDYEWMCEEIADGNPLLVNFIPGQQFGGLEYCRIYKSIGPAKMAVDASGDYTGHLAVLVGGISNGTEKGFWVLNSHSELWCPRFTPPSIPRSIWNAVSDLTRFFQQESRAGRGGIFKLNSDNIVWNAIKFSRSDDAEPVGSMIRNEDLYTKAASGSGECDAASVSPFLYDVVVGSHFNRRLRADQKEEETLSLFDHLPFIDFPAMPSPPCFSRRIQAKKILETFHSLPFSFYTSSPSEEETLSLFNNLPFSNFPTMPSPPCSSRRIEAKKILETFQSLPFSFHTTSPSVMASLQ